jgi:glycosyltransferase involved in cell wall biosynthesis
MPEPAAARISVVMPCHDVAPFVAEAVRSTLRQEWPDVELLAVDDGSTDGTGAMLDDLAGEWGRPGRRMVVRHQANAGAAAARNAGLALATGDLVAFLDADDRSDPGHLRAMADALAAEPALDAVFTLYRYIDEMGRVTGEEAAPGRTRFGPEDLLTRMIVHSPMLRAGAARAAGPVDETLTACIDLDHLVRVAALRPGNLGLVPEVLSDYRRRSGQITQDWRRMEANWSRVHRKLAAAGSGLSPAALSRARAQACLWWSTLAYEAGDHAAARRLVAETWRRDPRFAIRDRLALIRTLSVAAALLPASWHDAIRARFNASSGAR